MGYYVNPPSCTKEHWLETYGKRATERAIREHAAGDHLAVCLVDNGPFTAAAIAYDDRERDVFLHPDGRSKVWYIVPKAALQPWL